MAENISWVAIEHGKLEAIMNPEGWSPEGAEAVNVDILQ